MNISNLNTTNAGALDDEIKGDKTLIIVIGLSVPMLIYCYFCNRDKNRDSAEMEQRSSRAQKRLAIRSPV
jgi:hypothetical protein